MTKWKTLIIDIDQPGFQEWKDSLAMFRDWLYVLENDPFVSSESSVDSGVNTLEVKYTSSDFSATYTFQYRQEDPRQYSRVLILSCGESQLNISNYSRLYGTLGRIVVEYLGKGEIE